MVPKTDCGCETVNSSLGQMLHTNKAAHGWKLWEKSPRKTDIVGEAWFLVDTHSLIVWRVNKKKLHNTEVI
jgi:hypothetical protein